VTLFDKAKAYNAKAGRPIIRSADEVDFALMWLKGKITNGQAMHALDYRHRNYGAMLVWMANTLKVAYQEGKLFDTELRSATAIIALEEEYKRGYKEGKIKVGQE